MPRSHHYLSHRQLQTCTLQYLNNVHCVAHIRRTLNRPDHAEQSRFAGSTRNIGLVGHHDMQHECMPACAVGRDRDGWAVRSKAALLLVLATKKAGPAAVQALLPQLLLAAKESATHTEMVRPSALPPLAAATD